MSVIKYEQMNLKPITMDEADKVSKAIVVGKDEGWDGYAMRVFSLGPGGHTPKHQHDWEHVNYIMKGKGRLLIDGQEQDVKENDFAFVPPGAEHQFSNPYDEPFEFICIVPNRGEY
jgi:quercetin dioxygenase-like cupin family protein